MTNITLSLLSLNTNARDLLPKIILGAGLILFSLTSHAEEGGMDTGVSDEAQPTSSQAASTQTEEDSETAEPIQVLPEAKNIDLSQPVITETKPEPAPIPAPSPSSAPKTATETTTPPAKSSQDTSETQSPQTPTDEKKPTSAKEVAKEKDKESLPAKEAPWIFLNTMIPRGTTTRLSWSPDQSFEGIATPTPVLIARGIKAGPKLCLTAALHGDELNGIEIVRRVMYNINAAELTGTVIGVPIVNLQGFRRSSRYLTDRRDLNRFFPGNPAGSSAARIAYSFFEKVIRQCDLLVDLHTGSFYRTNLPQLRANLNSPNVVELTKAFDAIAVLHSEGALGTLRRAAVDADIPAVTLEAGGPMELNEDYVEQGVKAINTLLDKNGMLDTISFWGAPQPTFYSSIWVRVNQGGILFSDIKLGARVKKGDLLGKVTDPITNIRSLVFSPVQGRILGMAVNQVVLPGFAAYHIGIDPSTIYATTLSPPDNAEGAQDNDEEEEASFDEFD